MYYMERRRRLGAQKVRISQGLIFLRFFSFLGYQPNIQVLQHLYLKSKTNNKRQNELIPYNDCLYRNMYRYEYIALLDIDEVNFLIF